MIRIENATNLVNNSTADVEMRVCFSTHEKNAAAESIFHALTLLELHDAEVIKFWL